MWYRQEIKGIRRHNVSQVSFYFLLLCICWTLHGILDYVKGDRLLSGYNNSVNAVETERSRGGTWMNDFDGGMMDTLWIEMG